MSRQPTVAFYTLGCKVNQYDTDSVAGLFISRGYRVVRFDDPADVYVINTCTVTHTGDRKSRQVIRRAVRQNPEAVIAVMGCYAQLSPSEIAEIEGVDIVLGTAERGKLVDLVEEIRQGRQPARPACVVNDVFAVAEFEEPGAAEYNTRTRATIKIQDGCNQFCAYCAVPYARGRSRSRQPESVVREVASLAGQGFREIVLAGIHLGGYGKDLAGDVSLATLLHQLHEIDGIERIRIGSIDSYEIDEALLAAVKELDKVCPHLHIALQSGDDEVLKLMRRRYTTAEFQQVIDRVRAAVPDIGITTDVIVGFPGETETHFHNTVEFIRQVGFSRLHVFQYSRREGTAAADFPNQVPAAAKKRRCQELIEVGNELSEAFHKRFVGQTVTVLMEQPAAEEGAYEGLTDNYIRVTAQAARDLSGQMVKVTLTSADANGAFGHLVS